MKRKNLLFVLLCINFVAKGQIAKNQIAGNIQIFPNEKTELVINTHVMLAGEPLQYKIYNHTDSGTTSSLSKVAYVSLRNIKDSVIFEHKLKLGKGMAQGSFFVPTGLATGAYQLLGYTNFSLNNSENGIAFKSIYIINPYVTRNITLKNEIDSVQQIRIIPDTITDTHLITETNDISLNTNKSTYTLREGVDLTVENLNGTTGFGNYALSVRRVDPIKISKPQGKFEAFEIQDRNIFYLPELRGELIMGRVLAVDGENPIENQTVAFTAPGTDYVFKMAKTNRHGRFFISIDEPYETANSIIQIVGPNRDKYKIILDDTVFNAATSESIIGLGLDPIIKDWLLERSIQLQIQNAYFNEESIAVTEAGGNPRFHGNLGREYRLDDYTRFPSVQETFVEIITFARVRKKNGKDMFEVFDPYNPYKEGPYSSRDPLLLLDGMLVQDHDEVLGFSAHELDRIHVFPGPYRYGPGVFWGIIDITSKKGDFMPRLGGEYIKEFELESPLVKRSYTSPNYSDEALQRIPDYRVQLLWEADLKLGAKKRVQRFYTSDVPGTYQIVLKGYSEDGKYIRAKQYFEVK